MKQRLHLPVQLPEFGILTYQILCVAAASAIFLLRYSHSHYLVNFLALVFGLGAVATGIRIGPILYLVAMSVALITDGWSMYGGDWGEPTRALDILLALCVLAYVAGHYRLQGLQHSILPLDPRRRRLNDQGRSRVERPARSARLVTVNEIGLLVLSLPIFALAAQFTMLWLGLEWEMPGIPGDLGRLLVVLWLTGVALLLTATVLAHWRRRQYDALPARMMLQDALWKETRGEQRRINRWRVLGIIRGRETLDERKLRDEDL